MAVDVAQSHQGEARDIGPIDGPVVDMPGIHRIADATIGLAVSPAGTMGAAGANL
jgi:hypothetical protein